MVRISKNSKPRKGLTGLILGFFSKSIVWCMTCGQLLVIFSPVFIVPWLYVDNNFSKNILLIVLTFYIVITPLSFINKLSGKMLEMPKAKFSRMSSAYLFISWVYSLTIAGYGLYVILSSGLNNFNYNMLSYFLAYVVYLFYKKIIVGSVFGR